MVGWCTITITIIAVFLFGGAVAKNVHRPIFGDAFRSVDTQLDTTSTTNEAPQLPLVTQPQHNNMVENRPQQSLRRGLKHGFLKQHHGPWDAYLHTPVDEYNAHMWLTLLLVVVVAWCCLRTLCGGCFGSGPSSRRRAHYTAIDGGASRAVAYYNEPQRRPMDVRDCLWGLCLFECCCRDNRDIDCCELCCCLLCFECCCPRREVYE